MTALDLPCKVLENTRQVRLGVTRSGRHHWRVTCSKQRVAVCIYAYREVLSYVHVAAWPMCKSVTYPSEAFTNRIQHSQAWCRFEIRGAPELVPKLPKGRTLRQHAVKPRKAHCTGDKRSPKEWKGPWSDASPLWEKYPLHGRNVA